MTISRQECNLTAIIPADNNAYLSRVVYRIGRVYSIDSTRQRE